MKSDADLAAERLGFRWRVLFGLARALALQSLSSVPLPMLRLRFALLRHFNERLQKTLHCFELGSTHAWSTGCVCAVRVDGLYV